MDGRGVLAEQPRRAVTSARQPVHRSWRLCHKPPAPSENPQLTRGRRPAILRPRRTATGQTSPPRSGPARGWLKSRCGRQTICTRKSLRSTEIWTISLRTIGCEVARKRTSLLISVKARPEPPWRVSGEASFRFPGLLSPANVGIEKRFKCSNIGYKSPVSLFWLFSREFLWPILG